MPSESDLWMCSGGVGPMASLLAAEALVVGLGLSWATKKTITKTELNGVRSKLFGELSSVAAFLEFSCLDNLNFLDFGQNSLLGLA